MTDSTRLRTYDGTVEKPVYPLVLCDTYDEGICENRGWVEATVDEERARDVLAEFCVDEYGKLDYRPECGPAKKVWLAPKDTDAEEWLLCGPVTPGAIRVLGGACCLIFL